VEEKPRNELFIQIDGKKIQPPDKILTGDQLLEVAGLSSSDYDVYLVYDGGNRKHLVDSREAMEVQNGMNFATMHKRG
jgi:hypothetical protein